MPRSSNAWQDRQIAGHPVEILEPAQRRSGGALLLLPDWGERAGDHDDLTAVLRELGVPTVAPVATSWWLDLIEPAFDESRTPQDFLQRDLLDWIARTWDIAPPDIRLLGWGTGGQGVLQLAFRRSRDFPRLVAIDPAIDFHELHGRDSVVSKLFPNREAARQQTALLRMHPAGWPRHLMLIADRKGFWFEGADRLAMKLRSMGIPLETIFYPESDPDPQQSHVADRGGALRGAVAYLLKESRDFPVIER